MPCPSAAYGPRCGAGGGQLYRSTSGQVLVSAEVLKVPVVENGGTLSLESRSGFLENQGDTPINIELIAELAIYAPPEKHSMPVNGSTFIPDVGRCRSDASDMLIVDCQALLRTKSRIHGFWGNAMILSQAEDRSLLPALHPISLLGGGFSASSNYDNKPLTFEVRKVIAHVQRKIELRGIRLKDYER